MKDGLWEAGVQPPWLLLAVCPGFLGGGGFVEEDDVDKGPGAQETSEAGHVRHPVRAPKEYSIEKAGRGKSFETLTPAQILLSPCRLHRLHQPSQNGTDSTEGSQYLFK